MKIQKIKTLKNYKSFSEFSWNKFCKNASNQEEILQKFSVVFGENGAGKSAICDVLKSVSQAQNFPNTPPTLAEVEINESKTNKSYIFQNGSWVNQVAKNAFLFFDVDFINANVHTHGLRSSNLQQGAHTQRAGKLIIDLDEQANNLVAAVKVKKDNLDALQTSCSDILEREFTDKDRGFFQTNKNNDEITKSEKLAKLQEELKKIETGLIALQKLNKQYAEIGRLSSVGKVVVTNSLSSKQTYVELFNRQIKERSQDKADVKIKAHFEKHKRFIESAKEQIPQNYKDENCPLCMQPLVNASKVIEYYRAAYDQTYEAEKHKFLTDIQAAKNELELIKATLNLLPASVTTIFDALERIKTDFEILDIYKVDEKIEHTENFRKVSAVEIDELLSGLESLKSIDRKELDVAGIHDSIVKRLGEVKKFIDNLNKLINTKNQILKDFQSKYSDQNKVTDEIQEKSQKQTDLSEEIDFLKSEKVELIKSQNEANIKHSKLSEELKKTQEDLKNYLANTIPKSVIVQMIAILGKFNLSFTLEHIEPSPNTRDYSFSFRIKDQNGNEREFKNGLSEGERQLISLAFFFAVNEKIPNKNKTVLIFDDPITSLDSPNLKILAELIHKKTVEFSQVIVFTHHPLFFKYLAKCESPNPCKFGVLKNSDNFGGSFMFFDPGFDLTTEVQKCNEEINKNAKSGNLKPEEIALKYGQLLRLAVEKFIKNDLLMWDKEKRFDEVTENLKQGRNKMVKLSDDDLEIMTNMYKYCNYSNLLHADKESPSGLSELMNHIGKFVSIIDKAKN